MMDAKRMTPAKAAWIRHLTAGFILLSFGMAACFFSQTPASDTKVKREEWRESRGPVIPHDSFPSDCTLCHAKGSWHEIRKDFVFDHAKETGTALNGAHEHAQCLRCHNDRGSVADFAKRGCAGCHEDLHRGRLGVQCLSCHGESNWNPTGIYAAHGRTRFPLTGAHVGVGCFRCHPAAESGQFLGADPRCESCHLQDARNVQAINLRAPDHTALVNCGSCHSPATWLGARFDHAGITNNCQMCHTPSHTTPGLPTNNCEACHTTTTWTFNHSKFSSFPDTHRGANKVCAKCHEQPGNYKSFTCLSCHPHNDKADTDSHHQPNNVPGYVYASPNCLSCHPSGNAQKLRPPLPKTKKK